MANEHLVEAAYRVLLGRHPESERVVADLAKSANGDVESILRSFVNSDEFKVRHSGFLDEIGRRYAGSRLPVDTEVPEDLLDRFFQRIQAQWRKLGDNEPFYSVLTHEQYKSARFGENSERFYASGAEHAAMVDYFAERNGVTLDSECCLELGCGVGRVTRYLAQRFKQVVAVDISEGNLAHCRSYLQRTGVDNVTYCLLSSPTDIKNLPQASFFYSIITLQHNPPPVQRYLLDQILAKLGPAACCLFQTATSGINYTFNAARYLDSEAPEMEVHCIPMHVVLQLLQQHEFSVKEVIIDAFTGSYGSHTFFAQRR
jgi:SAM-dependent methyltransferase